MIPNGNIDWTKLEPDEDVIAKAHHFEARGCVVCWGSQDAREATSTLLSMAVRTNNRLDRWHAQHVGSTWL